MDRLLIAFAILGVLPDADFLFGTHSTYSHSIGAAVVVGLIVAAAGRFRAIGHALAATMAYGSHVLLDWLGQDAVAPVGIMALWPFDGGFYLSSWHLFLPIRREYWEPGFLSHTLRAVSWELLLLGPLAVGAWHLAVRRRRPPA